MIARQKRAAMAGGICDEDWGWLWLIMT
jgi:hypothetical protein